MMKKPTHYFYDVYPSPWPFLISLSALGTVLMFIAAIQAFSLSYLFLLDCFLLMVYYLFRWWIDVIKEATYKGVHNKKIQAALIFGMVLFIISELMLFLTLFWVYFDSCFDAKDTIGSLSLSRAIERIDFYQIPFLNTVLLLASCLTGNYAYYLLKAGITNKAIKMLATTLLLGTIFTIFQGYEYYHVSFTISDNIYASIFYLLTGFHGLHVIIGSLFLLVCYVRLVKRQFTKKHHVGLGLALIYWHFVDIIWLFLFGCVYYWGNPTYYVLY